MLIIPGTREWCGYKSLSNSLSYIVFDIFYFRSWWRIRSTRCRQSLKRKTGWVICHLPGTISLLQSDRPSEVRSILVGLDAKLQKNEVEARNLLIKETEASFGGHYKGRFLRMPDSRESKLSAVFCEMIEDMTSAGRKNSYSSTIPRIGKARLARCWWCRHNWKMTWKTRAWKVVKTTLEVQSPESYYQ